MHTLFFAGRSPAKRRLKQSVDLQASRETESDVDRPGQSRNIEEKFCCVLRRSLEEQVHG
jgi:hypothetical protein